MIMFQARGRWRKVVQRSHPFGAGTASVSKRSSFLCNLSLFMFIFLAIYSYSCLETMNMPLFSGAGEHWERVCEAAEAVEQQVGEHHSKRWNKSPHTAAADLLFFDKVCVEAGPGSKVVGFVGGISIHTRCVHSELLAGSERAEVGCKRWQRQLFRDRVLESVHVLARQLRDDELMMIYL